MKTILAIDPGTTHSGWIIFEPQTPQIVAKGDSANPDVIYCVINTYRYDEIRCEMIGHYGTGMPAGREVFETCLWIGRFMQAAESAEKPFRLVMRRDVKLQLCGSAKAKDQNVRQAVLDRLGPPGTKKAPGVTYGVSGHIWQALAIALIE